MIKSFVFRDNSTLIDPPFVRMEDKRREAGRRFRVREGLSREVTGAGAGELVGVDEEPSVGITGVDREHPVVDVLLGALGLL